MYRLERSESANDAQVSISYIRGILPDKTFKLAYQKLIQPFKLKYCEASIASLLTRLC